MTPDDAGSATRAHDAHAYLARISDAAVANACELAGHVGPGGKGLFLSQVVRDTARVESRSPTRERAAQFQGVYEELIRDALLWLKATAERVGDG